MTTPQRDAKGARREPGDAPELLIVAGEVSGDMLATGLVKELRRKRPDLRCFGIGGDGLRACGVELLYHTSDMAVMGVSEVLRRYGFFRRAFHHVLAEAASRRPAAAVLVDYPGFNLRLAAKLHAMGIRVIYYVCPQVWAWNRGRIPAMARCVDRLIALFPFEPACFEGTGLRVDFVGHPLAGETAAALREPPAALPWAGRPRVALLPGSRRHEISRLLPPFRAASRLLENRFPEASFIVAAPSGEQAAQAQAMASATPGPARWATVTGLTRQVLRQADAALVASGTATLEAALMECPMVVAYRVAWPTYWLGRLLVRVPHIGMVNIVAGRRLCAEFVQRAAHPSALADAVTPLLTDTRARRACLTGLRDIRQLLDSGDAAAQAAAIVFEEAGLSGGHL